LPYFTYVGTMEGMQRHFATFTQARTHLRDVLDAAHTGRVATVARDRERFAVVDADVLRRQLVSARPARAVVAAEGGGWSAFLPGVGVHGDGDTFDDALADLVEALRDYAEAWNERLLDAPNHRDNWSLVTLVELSDDDQLREWIIAPQPSRFR
jgi:predicted RNase H-like HicB family nuclease